MGVYVLGECKYLAIRPIDYLYAYKHTQLLFLTVQQGFLDISEK